jgi:hypothetical protein
VSEKKDLTDEEQPVDAPDIDGLIDPEDAPGSKKRKTHSRYFTDDEIAAMPSYTPEELAALPEPWTKRGEMISADRPVIQGLAGKSKAASRIFVTGEVAEDCIGGAAARLLLSINDVYYTDKAGCEPLFVQTRDDTIRMARFDPRFVWQRIHPDTLVELVQAEIDRLGVGMDPWKMDYFDFYQNMAAAMKAACGEDIILVKAKSGIDDFYHGVYLACLLLFGKPGYMDVPVAEHFAQREAADFLRSAVFLQLDADELKRLEKMREEYGNIRALTNPEMHYVVDLYERLVKQ